MESYQSVDITELAKAMLKVQSTLQPAFKDRENTFSKSRYATLNSVMDACREALITNGIWLVQHPVPVENGHLGLLTKLVHTESGQWQSSLMTMPLPKSDPQGYGSALTYARRYSLSALVGIVTEDDDDGEGAKIPEKSGTASKRGRNAPQTHEVPPGRTTPASPQKNASEPTPGEAHFPGLPKIDGITYQTITAQDGRPCVIASGKTQPKKEMLVGIGFKWNPQRKMWWKYADAS